jgi:hypothetical protein
LSAAKASVGVKMPGKDCRPRRFVSATTPASKFGETIRRPPASATSRTSSSAVTVPAPIRARFAEGLGHGGDAFQRVGRVQRHLDPVDPGGDQRLGHRAGLRRGQAAQDGDDRAAHDTCLRRIAARARIRPSAGQAGRHR